MSHAQMVEINTERLWKDIKRNGAKLPFVSKAIGRQPGYMGDALRRGRISVKALSEVSKLLGADPRKYTAAAEPKETPAAEREVPVFKKHQDLTTEERTSILQATGAAGRKAEKLPHINMAFAPDVYKYIQIMSRVHGVSMTQFTNLAVKEYAKNHEDLYARVEELRKQTFRGIL